MDQMIRRKLADHIESPSENATIRMMEAIQLRRNRTLMRKWSIAASVLLVLGLVSYFTVTFNPTTEPVAIQLQVEEPGAAIDQNFLPPDEAPAVQGDDPVLSDRVMLAGSENQGHAVDHYEPIYENENLETTSGVKKVESDKVALSEILAAEAQGVTDSLVSRPLLIAQAPERLPEMVNEVMVEEPNSESPVLKKKVVIEYKSSSAVANNSKLRKMYERLDNMKSADEMLADLRTMKDQFFAFEFIRKDKDLNNQNNQ